MEHRTLERDLEIVNQAQADYKSKLDSIIPQLLKNISYQMREKRIAIRLTGYFDAEGSYLDPFQKRNGVSIYYFFLEGIKRIETFYDEEGLPKTREILVSTDDFLRWVKEEFIRTEEVYNRLIGYQHQISLEVNSPTDEII